MGGTAMRTSRRTLAVLDVENLLGVSPARADEQDYQHAVHRFAAAAGIGRTDHLVVASAPRGAAAFGVRAAWPPAVMHTRSGIDGADIALGRTLADLDTILRCNDKVIIGSGDHYFTEAVIALRSKGVPTIVVSWPDRLSRQLREAAPETRLLTDQPSQYALAA